MLKSVLLETRGREVVDEGCLACPGISVPIHHKPPSLTAPTFADGEEWVIEGDGLLGRCLQHEIDHLDGKTLFESCDSSARIQALHDYEEAKAAGAKPGDTRI